MTFLKLLFDTYDLVLFKCRLILEFSIFYCPIGIGPALTVRLFQILMGKQFSSSVRSSQGT